jgi:hypothetical protein
MSALAIEGTSDVDRLLPADERLLGNALDSGLRSRLEAALDLEAGDRRRLRLSIANTSVTDNVPEPNRESVTVRR